MHAGREPAAPGPWGRRDADWIRFARPLSLVVAETVFTVLLLYPLVALGSAFVIGGMLHLLAAAAGTPLAPATHVQVSLLAGAFGGAFIVQRLARGNFVRCVDLSPEAVRVRFVAGVREIPADDVVLVASGSIYRTASDAAAAGGGPEERGHDTEAPADAPSPQAPDADPGTVVRVGRSSTVPVLLVHRGGRVGFSLPSDDEEDFLEAARLALGDIPVIRWDGDVESLTQTALDPDATRFVSRALLRSALVHLLFGSALVVAGAAATVGAVTGSVWKVVGWMAQPVMVGGATMVVAAVRRLRVAGRLPRRP